jgi:pimeloyl-ACP methyl ester carboxylesterase
MKFSVKVFPENLKLFFLRLLICLVLIMLGLLALQNYLLYQPSTYSVETLKSLAAQERLTLWPKAGLPAAATKNLPVVYRGLLAEPKGPVAGTAVVTHGNAGSAIDRTGFVGPLLALGYRVILLEYPGYGAREGRPSEKALVADARTSIRLARDQFGPPILLIGESLGSGVAAEATAGLESQIDGLMLCTPWNDLPSVAQSIYRFLPVKYLVREKYDSVKNLKNFPHPVLLVVAEKDELIPPECSKILFDSLPGQKKMHIISGAGHNTWLDRVGNTWWKEVLQDMK